MEFSFSAKLLLALVGTVATLALGKAVQHFLTTRKFKRRSKAFICTRCRKWEEHGNRTVRAAMSGQRHFFCRSCHEAWLSTKAPRTNLWERRLQKASPAQFIQADGAGWLWWLFVGVTVSASVSLTVFGE